jgi:hypothetical protein
LIVATSDWERITAKDAYSILVGLAASAFFAPLIAAATAWFENNRCLAVSLGAASAFFCCQKVHRCWDRRMGRIEKYCRCRIAAGWFVLRSERTPQ